MAKDQAVLGVYSYLDSTIESLDKLKEEGYDDFRVFSPCPQHELEAYVKGGESPVRFFTLFGAVFGAICGFAITIVTSLAWPLRVGAKNIVSIPPYMIIVFELTILFGALFTLVGLLYYARLRRNVPSRIFDTRFGDDKFGITVLCEKNQIEAISQILKVGGAEEVRFEGV